LRADEGIGQPYTAQVVLVAQGNRIGQGHEARLASQNRRASAQALDALARYVAIVLRQRFASVRRPYARRPGNLGHLQSFHIFSGVAVLLAFAVLIFSVDGVLATATLITGGVLLRVGVGPIAATVFAIGFIFCLSLMTDRTPLRTEGGVLSVSGIIDRKLGLGVTLVGLGIQDGFRSRWAGLPAEEASKFAFDESGDQAEPWSARSSFRERFSFEQPDSPSASLQISASFGDRFDGEFTASGATARSAAATQRPTVQRVATATLRVPWTHKSR
jgi:hypothetical protein